MTSPVVIVWFKRDLRLHDHAPLQAALASDYPVMPLYVIEPEYWQQPFASRRHWHFIHDCLSELRRDCQALGQPLILRQGDVCQIFERLAAQFEVKAIHAHQESGNAWTYQRDKAVIAWCNQHHIALHEHPCNGVVRRLASRDDWSAIRNQRMALPLIPKPDCLPSLPELEPGSLPSKNHPLFGPDVPGITQPGGRRAAVQTLTTFLQQRGKDYLYRLSAPGDSEQSCSRLSPHLAWGTLSVREVEQARQRRRRSLPTEQQAQWQRHLSAFASRLSWRCHFVQKIEDQPSIEQQCMHPAFAGLREKAFSPAYFQAWCEGRTGYPLIDACMRNLIYTGWITFRMRAMLVSFASYHLWLDWRITGDYLARLFTDYEPGIHYSQLQMQSGVTGINSLRIYNPIKQSQQHDPAGHFIRRWVPELAQVSDSWIHTPWQMPDQQQTQFDCLIGKHYPAPIVDHREAVKIARSRLAEARRDPNFADQAERVYRRLGSRKRTARRRKKTTEPSPQLSLWE